MDVSAFVRLFGGGDIRVKLDWQRVAEECVVEERFTCSREELGQLCTVWYVDEFGRDAGYDYEGARPLRVSEVEITEATWPPARASMIAALRRDYASADSTVTLTLPAYLVGGEVVLLDGNHRAAAAYLAEADTCLRLYLLSGPTDSEVLPDLGHYSS
ncbi:hypothetical protein [Amycolatopsis sp. NPDC102389]|uniref:hypothetical protein n=1 Tax=Amycolatopsis sp. NPDC102389 TaxID=3363941 RepID=UPI003816F06F